VGLSRAARRKVRQVVELATFLDVPKVELYGVVWFTSGREQHRQHCEQQQQEQRGGKAARKRSTSQKKHDEARSARHNELMERVRKFQMRRAFGVLRGCAPLALEAKCAEQKPEAHEVEQLPPGGQQLAAMDDERTTKQLARSRPSPAPAESPLGERQPKRAQRALALPPPDPPPPSIPPSPPTSTPPTPPQTHGKVSPEEDTKPTATKVWSPGQYELLRRGRRICTACEECGDCDGAHLWRRHRGCPSCEGHRFDADQLARDIERGWFP
jgi:hypothetical protein